jgi:gliding motility-associated-like protein
MAVVLVNFLWTPESCAQRPSIQWQRTLGGNADDLLYDLILTSDGGYMAVGRTESGTTGDKTGPKRGGTDIWVIKLNVSGAIEWQKTIGGVTNDHAANVIQTSDGGYALGGFSSGGISGDRTTVAKGYVDYWIIKLDATGVIQWQKTYGGITEANQAYTFIQTPDGGFVLGGMSTGFKGPPGDKTEDPKGDFDYWMIKTDGSGNLQWDKTIGGAEWDQMHMAALTADGGYIIGGWSYSGMSADKSEPNAGAQDSWFLKLNSSGTIEWQKSLGGNGNELPSRLLQQTADGGYMAGTTSHSGVSGNRTEASRGGDDFWLVKLDATGNIAWQKALGGSGDDVLEYGYQTGDKGYLLAGHSASDISGDKTTAPLGRDDWWIVKLNEAGAIEFQWSFGGNNDDILNVIRPTADGGYILGGSSESGVSGDKTESSRGGRDFWIVKLGPRPPVVKATNCQGTANKAWTTPAQGDDLTYTYTWYNAAKEVVQVYAGTKGDTLFNLAPGSYTVDAKNAVNTITLPFSISPDNYNASFTTGSLCKADSFTVTNTSTNHFITYQWEFGDGNSATGIRPSHAYSQNKDYSIRLIAATASGCADTATQVVKVNSIPAIVAQNYGNTVCSGTPMVFSDGYSEPIASWYWSFDDGTTATIAQPSKVFATGGRSYKVIHSVVSANGCVSDTVPSTILVYATPVVNAGPDLITGPDEPIALQGSATAAALTIRWTPAGFLSGDALLRPVATAPASLWFYLSATGEGACTAIDSMKLDILIQVKIPNVFTPNSDGINDVWVIPGLDKYENSVLTIFNRWGQQVYQSKGYKQPWNGQYNGQPLPAGTYYYVINLGNNDPRLQGAVTILR